MRISLMGSQFASFNEKVNRTLPSTSAGYGIPSSAQTKMKTNPTLVLMATDKEKTQDYTGLPFKNIGGRSQNVIAPETTLRDTLSSSNAGPMNVSVPKKDNTGYSKIDHDLQMTSKAMNSETVYQGQPTQNLGMGTRIQKIEAWITNKELNQHSQTGNPTGQVPAHMSYDAVFENGVNNELEIGYIGAAKNPVTMANDQVPNFQNYTEKLFVSDYTGNPNSAITQPTDRNFEATQTYNPVNFGGHYFTGKKAGGEDAKRTARYRAKDQMNTGGRVNIGSTSNAGGSTQNCTNKINFEMNLKNELPEGRELLRSLAQPIVRSRLPISIQTSNLERHNSRVDPGIQVARGERLASIQ
ncbi:hypothetical protein HDU81_010390 [Chytriomyces hyalinus]|nr:hypothetical protein HDU81_010390 [Chytriomyces hyalinus]